MKRIIKKPKIGKYIPFIFYTLMAIFILLDIISFLGTPGALGSFIFVPLIFGVGIYQIQKNKSLRGWFIINNLSLAILFSAPAYVNNSILDKVYLIITLLIILFINTSSFLSYYSLQEIERYRAEYKCERKEVQGKYFEKISLILIMIVSLLCIVACIISYRYQHQYIMCNFLPTIEELCTQCLCAITLILGIGLIIRRIPNYGWLLVNVSSLSLLILIPICVGPCGELCVCLSWIIPITSLIITNRKSFKEYYSILK